MLSVPCSCLQLLLAFMAVVGVFLLVPRGVSVGTLEVHSTKMTFNATTLTYRIILEADVPIYNPNYLKVGQVYFESKVFDILWMLVRAGIELHVAPADVPRYNPSYLKVGENGQAGYI
jgi:hypothetical protein